MGGQGRIIREGTIVRKVIKDVERIIGKRELLETRDIYSSGERDYRDKRARNKARLKKS